MPDSNSSTKALLTIPEVMERLSLGRSALYEQMKAGRLRFIKLGRSRRIPAAAVDEFVKLLERECVNEVA
ncbi:hypothetical protein BJF83_18870 [Nocardiopsis sp. CNR-923]|uniref:helix-turn-helix transcriptional regulator n=1 Tax=Nocardiopsis sp. CNR-923 TaxID=1904965 RepID=UPI000964A2E5|nr:excisionase family DNA-binding protein [Nocardiopsis sp. CNR-923]OLT27158.1 hypothetical protein BJF83_18870 [Nocardiopsis sp. CNR-923]